MFQEYLYVKHNLKFSVLLFLKVTAVNDVSLGILQNPLREPQVMKK